MYTERNSEATMLQALEVMNGATLANVLHRGAQRMLGELPQAARRISSTAACADQQGADTVFVDIDISRSKRLILLLEDVDTYDPARLVAGWANAELVGPDGAVTPLAAWRRKRRSRRRRCCFKNQKQPLDGLCHAARFARGLRLRAARASRAFARRSASDMRVATDPMFWARFDFSSSMKSRTCSSWCAWQAIRRCRSPTWRYPADQFTTRLFQYALLRDPLPKEREIAGKLLGGKNGGLSSDGLEDLLWSIFLLPEFQYVR